MCHWACDITYALEACHPEPATNEHPPLPTDIQTAQYTVFSFIRTHSCTSVRQRCCTALIAVLVLHACLLHQVLPEQLLPSGPSDPALLPCGGGSGCGQRCSSTTGSIPAAAGWQEWHAWMAVVRVQSACYGGGVCIAQPACREVYGIVKILQGVAGGQKCCYELLDNLCTSSKQQCTLYSCYHWTATVARPACVSCVAWSRVDTLPRVSSAAWSAAAGCSCLRACRLWPQACSWPTPFPVTSRPVRSSATL